MQVALEFLAVAVVYLAALMTASKQYQFMLKCVPVYAIIAFGCYSLARIGYSLITLRTDIFI